MVTLKTQDQGIIELLQEEYLPILIDSFLIDRKAQRLSPGTVQFYRKKLNYFIKFCEGQAVTQVTQLTSDLIRRYLLENIGNSQSWRRTCLFSPSAYLPVLG